MNPMNHVLDYFIDLSKISFDDSNLSNIQVNTIIQNIMMELYEISFDIVKSKNIIPVQETRDVYKRQVNYLSITGSCMFPCYLSTKLLVHPR